MFALLVMTIRDRHIHLLGSHTKIKVARDAICDLIMGSPAGKVTSILLHSSIYLRFLLQVMTKLRTVSARLNDRF